MDRNRIRTWGRRAAVLGLAVGVGCTETQMYSVSVRNTTARPVTVCLTKTYGPAEPGWESPEQMAGPAYPASDERPPGAVVLPGKTASEGPIPGDFYRDRGRAVLRVYGGTPTLTQMNAISPGSPDRLDVPLHPGGNAVVVELGPDGRMEAVAAGETTASTPRPPGTTPDGY